MAAAYGNHGQYGGDKAPAPAPFTAQLLLFHQLQCRSVLLFGGAAAAQLQQGIVHQLRHLRRLLQPGRQVRLQGLDQARRADALAHPVLKERLGSAPQIQLRIQLAAQAFHVQQGFLQQHQLRLHFHIEATGGLEQAQQEVAERNVFQRPLENRLAHGTDGGFEFVHPGIRRYPAGLYVQLGHLAVIPAEERQQVAGQVAFIVRGQGSDNAEIDGNVFGIRRVGNVHKDVARVHVGVEEAVPEHLGEKDLHAFLGQHFHVHAGISQSVHIGNGNAVDALHHQYGLAGVIPVDEGDVDQLGVFEVATQLAGVGGFPLQVQLVVDGGIVDRKSTRLNSSHVRIPYAVFCVIKKNLVEHTLADIYFAVDQFDDLDAELRQHVNGINPDPPDKYLPILGLLSEITTSYSPRIT